MLAQIVGERVRAAREAKGWTLKELAERAHVSVSFLSDIENGRSVPAIGSLRSIAEALEVTTDYLLGRTDKPTGYGEQIATQYAHREDGYDEELPEEAVQSIEEFKEFIRQKYGKRK